MASIIILSGFCVLLLFIGVVSLIFFAVSATPAINEKEQTTWQTLAETNNLTFVSKGPKSAGTRIIGKYRGHHLELDTFYKGGNKYDQISTSLVLFAKNSKEASALGKGKETHLRKFAPEDVVGMLAPSGLRYGLKGKIEVNQNARKIYYEQSGLENDAEYLQFLFDLFSDIADNYFNVLALGGEADFALLRRKVGQD